MSLDKATRQRSELLDHPSYLKIDLLFLVQYEWIETVFIVNVEFEVLYMFHHKGFLNKHVRMSLNHIFGEYSKKKNFLWLSWV